MNWSSSKQLGDLLFRKLKLPDQGTTKTGQFKVGVKELQKIKDSHPIVPLILERKKLSKLLNTYTGALIEKVSKKDGRIHPSFKQTGTETGRLSSENPNGQQIPKHTEEGKQVRTAFVAAPGTTLVSMDYSQIELRVLAQYSQDALLLKSFRNGDDIHQAVAGEVGVPRQVAKAVNFGLVYGSTEYGLAKTLNLDEAVARDYINRYFGKYKGVYYWMQGAKAEARSRGYVETLFGRRRTIEGIKSSNKWDRMSAERQALNTTIQGSAAEIMKIGMIKVHNLIKSKYEGKVKMVLQIHDDLVTEVHDDVLEDFIRDCQKTLESAVKLSVPIPVGVASGKTLGDL